MIKCIILSIIIILIVFLIILKKCMKIKIKELKRIKKDIENKELNNITDKLPDNINICKEILKILNNTHTRIEKNEENTTSLYIIATDKIIISSAKVNNTFMRIQTIAHECIHSVQNKKLLKCNFILSNIYILLFITMIVLMILTSINIIKGINIFIISMVIFFIISILSFIVRNYLEGDAMNNAPKLAEKYLNLKSNVELNIISNEEIEKLINKYNELNKIGINSYTYSLIFNKIIKIIMLLLIAMIII